MTFTEVRSNDMKFYEDVLNHAIENDLVVCQLDGGSFIEIFRPEKLSYEDSSAHQGRKSITVLAKDALEFGTGSWPRHESGYNRRYIGFLNTVVIGEKRGIALYALRKMGETKSFFEGIKPVTLDKIKGALEEYLQVENI